MEKKIRRHMMRAKKRKGFGWKRWSREWLYQVLGLFNDYRVRYYLNYAQILASDVKPAGPTSSFVLAAVLIHF